MFGYVMGVERGSEFDGEYAFGDRIGAKQLDKKARTKVGWVCRGADK